MADVPCPDCGYATLPNGFGRLCTKCGGVFTPPVQLRVVSFGYGHNEPPPPADITVDVRRWFHDPHIDSDLREKNGRDHPAVIDKVMDTPGVPRFVDGLWQVAQGLLELRTGLLTLAVGCTGGRHRAPVIAGKVAVEAGIAGWAVVVQHLHVDRPVIQRGEPS